MPSYVVIGASRGLGYEWLRQLSSDPSNTVFGLVRNLGKIEEQLSIDSLTNVHLIQADMADNVSLVAAAVETGKLTDSVDYLIVNGAYTNHEESFLTPTDFVRKENLLVASMTESMRVNVLGAVFCINAFLPLVRKSSIKKIIAISTALSHGDLTENGTISFYMIYSAMKAAMNVVVAKFAVELKSEGITVLTLSPGLVDTSHPDKPQPQMTPEQMQRVGAMIKYFQEKTPGFRGRIPVSESVIMQKKVIEGVTIENTGSFLSHHGDKTWL